MGGRAWWLLLILFAAACGGDDDGAASDGSSGAGTVSAGSGGAEGSSDAGSGGSPVGAGASGSAGRGGGGTGGGARAGSGGGSGTGGAGAGPGGASGADDAGSPQGPCFEATLLWSDDFESADYAAWTSQGYGDEWGNECQSTARSTEAAVSGVQSQRSQITCAYTAEGGVHRGYGGMQFDGDAPLGAFTNAGLGIDAPFGIVNTLWVRLDSDTVFENGRWLSLFTANGDCDWAAGDQVLTLGIEDPSDRLAAAHYQWGAGGERTFEPDAPGLPRGQWARLTIYVNYHDDEMHVWQDGASVSHVTFDRSLTTLCHFHWGLYASGDNDDIVLFEDDNSVWKLGEPWTDFAVEPWLGHDVATCP